MFEGIVILVNATVCLNILLLIVVKDACDDNVTVASELQLVNANVPIDVTELGILIDGSAKQYSNTPVSIVVIFEGIVILVNAAQAKNRLELSVVNDVCDDNVTDTSLLQFLNALELTVETVFGNVILVNPVLLNALLSIVVMFEGIVILVNAEQFLKVLLLIVVKDACDDNVTVASEPQLANANVPIDVTELGILIDTSAEQYSNALEPILLTS